MTKIEIITSLDLTDNEIKQAQEVFLALIKTGGIWGVKSGSTNIHYDPEGVFMGIRFDYWPWKRRALDKKP